VDPQACLERYWTAFLAEEWEEASEAWEALANWIRCGGFEPAWKHPYGREEFFKAHHKRPDRRASV
jgi:hypothetical protein